MMKGWSLWRKHTSTFPWHCHLLSNGALCIATVSTTESQGLATGGTFCSDKSHLGQCLGRHILTPANEEVVGEVAVLREEGQCKQVVQVDPLHQQPAVVGHNAVLHEHSGSPAPCCRLGNGKRLMGRKGKHF